jgi:hypothetical protein
MGDFSSFLMNVGAATISLALLISLIALGGFVNQ